MASSAVNSDTIVPIPSVNANPWTCWVASTNRMNAVMIVTTLASMIAVNPFLYPVAMPARIDRPARISSLTRSKMTMFASAPPDRQDQARDPGQRQRDRDQLDQRVEVDRVDDQRRRRDQTEHAVVGEQEQDHDDQPDPAGEHAVVQRLAAERRRHLALGDPLQVDRQRAQPQLRREVLRRGRREATGDVGAGAAAAVDDPVGVLGEVDLRDGEQLVVERRGEVLEVLRLAEADVRAAVRDRARRVLERRRPGGV